MTSFASARGSSTSGPTERTRHDAPIVDPGWDMLLTPPIDTDDAASVPVLDRLHQAPLPQPPRESPEHHRQRLVLPAAVAGAVVVVIVIVLTLTALMVRSRGEQTVTVVPRATDAHTGARAAEDVHTPGPRDSAARSSPPSAGFARDALVRVHVAGRVRHPGVVQVPSGARVSEVVTAAGGCSSGAAPDRINLARTVVDGERIVVPGLRDEPESFATADVGTAPVAGSGGPPSSKQSLININTATAVQLDQLPGIGPITAEKIVAWRTEHGRFRAVDDLGAIPGIGNKTVAHLRPRVQI